MKELRQLGTIAKKGTSTYEAIKKMAVKLDLKKLTGLTKGRIAYSFVSRNRKY